MYHPEALILRRCYPVPVQLSDLKKAYEEAFLGDYSCRYLYMNKPGAREQNLLAEIRRMWSAALKEITGALDEIYAEIDGREVRVAVTDGESVQWISMDPKHERVTGPYRALLHKADRDGYWERPHEVRLDLQERPISRDAVQRAVMVGQIYVEGQAGK